jgi:hypothetical protein
MGGLCGVKKAFKGEATSNKDIKAIASPLGYELF